MLITGYIRTFWDTAGLVPGDRRPVPYFLPEPEYKELDLYYDRAGNNFEKQKEDYAGKIKDAIEKDGSGNRTGWIVNLKSRKQAVIRQDAEYDFMQELMGGTNKNLPILLVDALNCKEMVSSK